MANSPKPKSPIRQTLFDYLLDAEKSSDSNKYCSKSVLGNEASIEEFFVRKLIRDLGYAEDEIKPKQSLSELTVAKGHKKENYKPDYVLFSKKPRWLMLFCRRLGIKPMTARSELRRSRRRT